LAAFYRMGGGIESLEKKKRSSKKIGPD